MAESKLSDARVRTASFAKDGSYLTDGGGLRIRLLPPSRNHPKGAKLCEFHFKLKDQGGDYRHGALHLGTLGDTFTDTAGIARPFMLADARRGRDAARELVARGIDPREADRLSKLEQIETQRSRLAELDERRTVDAAFRRWVELYLSAHRKDGGLFVIALFERHILPTIGALPLQSLRRAQVTEVLDAIVAAGALRTANMALSTVRQFVRWCLVRDWIAHDPTLGISKANIGGKERPRERALSTLEIIELRDRLPAAALPERIACAVWLLLATGARVGELSAATVADFDLDASAWHIPETKNGRAHLVHLSGFALRQVERLVALAGESEHLLPGRDGGALGDKAIAKMLGDRQRLTPLKGRSKSASTLVLARGKWTPHDLRRSMATQMRESLRVSSDVIERCLNHTPQGIVGVYQTGELMVERKAAFEAWGAELDRLMTADTSNVTTLQRAAA